MTRTAFPCLILVVALAGCGSTNGSDTAGQGGPPSPSVSLGDQPPSFGATYDLLPKEELDAALLGLQDVPAGYRKNPPSQDSANAEFCGKRAAEADVKVSRDFIKGGGLSTQVINVAISQYKSEQDAKDVYAFVTKTFETCHGEMFQGRKLTYALISVPKVGDQSFGLRITAGRSITYLANYAQVGPSVVTTVGGGYLTVSTDQISSLFRKQVASYQDAASRAAAG